MSEYKLVNEYVEAHFTDHAAEVTYFAKNSDHNNWIWSGDPAYWANRNPILFPIVGGMDEYEMNGNKYKMGNHGICRYADFECVYHDDQKVQFVLKDTEKSYTTEFPFHFELIVTYTLDKQNLVLHYDIINKDEKPLPFTLGFHPAFNTPLEYFNDVTVAFEKEESTVLRGSNERVSYQIVKCENNEFFSHGPAVFFDGIHSNYADLTVNHQVLRVHFDGFEKVGIWHKTPDTPFICIEPWHVSGMGSRENDLYKRAEKTIASGESYTTEYRFELL